MPERGLGRGGCRGGALWNRVGASWNRGGASWNQSHPDAFSNAAGASFAAEVPNAAEAPVAAVLHQRIFSMMTVHSAWMMNRAVWAACGHVPEPSRQHQQSSQSCCASWRIGGGLLSGIIPRRRCPQGCRFQDLQCPLLVEPVPCRTPLVQRGRWLR